MGEAKRREKEMSDRVRTILEKWSFEPTHAEADAVLEIDAIPPVRVERVDNRQLFRQGMERGACHANCDFYEKADLEQRWKRVTGWISDDLNGLYILHSIVQRGDERICITPQDDERPFLTFRPDPAVERVPDDKRYFWKRNGVLVTVGFRRDPAKTIAANRRLIGLLNAGEPPMSVMREGR
jgi:hypothetical protein